MINLSAPPVSRTTAPCRRTIAGGHAAGHEAVSSDPRLASVAEDALRVDPQVQEFIGALAASGFEPVCEQPPAAAHDEYEGMVKARGIAQDSHALENTSAPGTPKNTERMYATAKPFRSLPSRAIHSAPTIGILRSQGML